jgi:hypothetical protein
MTTELAKTPRWHVSTKQRVRARSLRINFTNAERIIWSALRAHRMNGAAFVARRQSDHTSWTSSVTLLVLLSRSMADSTSNQKKSSAMHGEILILPAEASVFCLQQS